MIPPASLQSRLYCAWPWTSGPRSLVTRCCRKSRLDPPAMRNRPMCETSNRPATLRTAKCSSRIEVYCCGISQQPKSTIRPPRATCLSCRGVRVVSRLADDGVHLLADPALGKRCEVGLGAGSEGSRRFDQAERALLDEVRHRKTLVLAPFGEADHHAEVGGHQPVQAGAIAQR